LGRLSLAAAVIWYILGVALLALLARFSVAPHYRAPATLLTATALLAILLAVAALAVLPPNRAGPKLEIEAPQPRAVFLTTCIASLVWHTMLVVLWRILPALSRWPLVLVPMLGSIIVVVAIVWLLRYWARARGWNDRDRLALASGALVSHNLIGSAILAHTAADRIGTFVLGLVTIVLLFLFSLRVRDRVIGSGLEPGPGKG
jgi:hypothetical protein